MRLHLSWLSGKDWCFSALCDLCLRSEITHERSRTDKGPTRYLRICRPNVESLLDRSVASHHAAQVKVRHLSPRPCKADLLPISLAFKGFSCIAMAEEPQSCLFQITTKCTTVPKSDFGCSIRALAKSAIYLQGSKL